MPCFGNLLRGRRRRPRVGEHVVPAQHAPEGGDTPPPYMEAHDNKRPAKPTVPSVAARRATLVSTPVEVTPDQIEAVLDLIEKNKHKQEIIPQPDFYDKLGVSPDDVAHIRHIVCRAMGHKPRCLGARCRASPIECDLIYIEGRVSIHLFLKVCNYSGDLSVPHPNRRTRGAGA